MTTSIAECGKSICMEERKLQYKILKTALTAKSLPPILFLHGLPSSGKSFVIEKVLEECKTAAKARISAAEAMCGKKAFFETIIRQLGVDNVIKKDGKSQRKSQCENAQMFLRILKECFEKTQKTVIVVVDNFESINWEKNQEIFTALLLAHNSCGLNICFVFSSTIPFSSFTTAKGGLVKSIPVIYFPQYSKEDIISIICRDVPKDADPSTYRFYVKTIVDVFYRSCRELRKLKRLATINYSEFAMSIPNANSENENSGVTTPRSGALKSQQLHKIWRSIEPKLKSDFVTLNSQFMQIEPDAGTLRKRRLQNIDTLPSASTSSLSKVIYDLPECSKYILIAAFIASSNPPSSDKRFFVKEKMKNTTVAAAKKRFTAERSTKTTAKVFPYNRLQAIFSAICSTSLMVQEKRRSLQNVPIPMDTAHMSQVMTLCDARLISVSGVDESLQNRKFKCLADFDLVNAISQSVDFELTKYLYDFL